MDKRVIAILCLTGMLLGCQPVAEESASNGTVAEESVSQEETESGEKEVLEGNAETAETPSEEQVVTEEEILEEETEQEEDIQEEFRQDRDVEGESEQKQQIILTEERKQQIEACLSMGDFSASPVVLEEIVSYLNEKGVYYHGFYIGGERADIITDDGMTLLFLETENQDGLPFGYELIMVNDMFNQWSFQENYYHAYDVIDDQYYYPELSERVWTEEDLSGFSRTELSIARNELFAKYGRIFEDPFLSQVFGVKSWYEPKYTAEEFDSEWQNLLTEVEKENLQTIMSYEKMWGWRGNTGQGRKEVKQLLSGSWLDLNGDGIKEQIIYQIEEYAVDGAQNGAGELSLIVKSQRGESKVSLDGEDGYLFHENCYVTSMDDRNYFLIVLDYGLSADYVCTFFCYQEDELTKVGKMATYASGLKVYEDKILAPTETCHLQCQPVDFEYVYQNGEFVHQPSEYYDYRGNTVTALRDFPLFAGKEDAEPSIILKEGEQVKILGGDLQEWVLLENADTGEQGWLKVTAFPDIVWISEEEGISCYDAFDGLYFYG